MTHSWTHPMHLEEMHTQIRKNKFRKKKKDEREATKTCVMITVGEKDGGKKEQLKCV